MRESRRSRCAVISARAPAVQVPGAAHGFDLLFPQARISERSLTDQVRALREALHP
ncbi:hypothetical protein [Streptomyces sp. NPDC014733]|uniref:hypothetical protein n=1 Tax=Streptomyces sp. NPDC014733 TaxID=3364885 RepID=UPI0036FE7A77